MTTPTHSLPVRIPELGPFLGKLLIGLPELSHRLMLDDIRLQLVDRIIGKAGEARRLAASGERDSAMHALGRDAWLYAWEEAVAASGDRLVDLVLKHFDAEFRAVRMPNRIRERFRIHEAERRAIEGRLGTAGACLIPAIDLIEAKFDAVQRRTALEAQAMREGEEAETRAARQLEAAWINLEQGIGDELDGWGSVADEISQWRRRWWPILFVGMLCTTLAVFLGLAVGGVVDMPRPLEDGLSAIRAFISDLFSSS